MRPGNFEEMKSSFASSRPLPAAIPSGSPGLENTFQPTNAAAATAIAMMIIIRVDI
jgi:hypothetical protein